MYNSLCQIDSGWLYGVGEREDKVKDGGGVGVGRETLYSRG
jgi:hypothetical protein